MKQVIYSTYGAARRRQLPPPPKSSIRPMRKIIFFVLVIAIATIGFNLAKQKAMSSRTDSSVASSTSHSPATATTQTSACSGNQNGNELLVSISQRKLWACQADKVVYSSPVVTGDTQVAADVTPLGTYHIYAKETNLYLDGTDSRGSWHDYVNYWMPFYDSPAYGTFGIHDATWRPSSAFGNINPDSDQASHGCVEMPLAAATWVYNWSSIGTTVAIEN